ncbi:phage tail terminator-like protein [Undibacterium sp. Ji49W]|uniref:phage tail terminator-like protein n=1 Tax=Undibacterium sp. Ji49W TaxID=3413040 RepID=UPI003BF31940
MSIVKIRTALETALTATDPSFATARENAAFTPVAGTPYQRLSLQLAAPDNAITSSSAYRDQGIFQVSLMYPLQSGVAAAEARIDIIRNAFKRGASFVESDHIITIDKTPEVAQGIVDVDRWMIPVKIRFYSNLMT